MIGWSFLISRRWAGLLALGIVFAVVCVLLGNWQFARRAEARAAIDRVENNWSQRPGELARAMPDPAVLDPDDTWLPVQVSGEYLVDEQLLVRNRPHNGSPGYEILVPLRTAEDKILVVDRGWIPTAEDPGRPAAIPPPPSGEVTVVVRLKPGEAAIAGRTATDGQLATIRLEEVAALLGGTVYTGAYGLLASEDPAAPTGALASRPEPDEGPHLSYALQWYVFAVMGFIGLGLLARQEYRQFNNEDPEEQLRAANRAARRAARPTDADIEDALLDSESSLSTPAERR